MKHKCLENMRYCSDCEWVYCSVCGRILGEFSSLCDTRTHKEIHEDFGFEPTKEESLQTKVICPYKRCDGCDVCPHSIPHEREPECSDNPVDLDCPNCVKAKVII